MRLFVLSFAFVVVLSACEKSAAAGVEQPAMPPSKVEVVTLAPRSIEKSTDYLASLSSRRAVTLYPQVSGYVRAINAKPGSTVKQGDVLLSVDAKSEQASLDNLVATRQSLEASAAFAKQRLDRSTALRGDGIVSQQDADQARVQADQAEASLRATDALIASQRARLGFFNIVAPFDGVVGHVPVKVGDFVTPASALTSVTQESGLEAEVWVPVERAKELSAKSRIRLLDENGHAVAEQPVSFVSPRADANSQLLLIKASFEPVPSLRADQLVHATVIWAEETGLAMPSFAVVRQAGQTFGFIVDSGKAKRVPITLGPLQGSDYVVTGGLDAGQQLIVSGIQMLGDGAPVEFKP
ncbi:MAG: efflux RND transporter periplasmic adaptor subunit [Archangium sp.]